MSEANFDNPEAITPPQSEKSMTSEFLSRVMVKLRQDRLPINTEQTHHVRYDQAMEGTFAQLWFQTRGCSWDRRGECTMCNYGHTAGVDGADMVSYVQEGLDSIDRPIDELYVSPSGSLFDSREVPDEARRSILQLVNSFPTERFSFETRPATITDSAVDELHSLLPNKQIAVGFGLESANQWILRHCINKPDTVDEFAVATRRLRDIDIYANTSLGAAFLSPAEAIDDTLHSVEWALANDTYLALVFPMHVKKHTLLEWMHQRGLYEPPSLWSLVKVLEKIEPSSIPKVNISWYRADYGVEAGVIASPTSCNDCEDTVLAALDQFRASPSTETVGRLKTLDCECRDAWKEAMSTPTPPIVERVLGVYQLLAEDLDLTDWWNEKSHILKDEIS